MEKKKTFKELFAGTGIEPTTNENGGVDYNFNATLKNKPMKLYTEEQVKDLKYWKNNAEEDYLTTPISVLRYISELEKLTPIELPSDEEIEKKTVITFEQDDSVGKYIFGAGAKWMKEQILNQNK